MAVITEYKGPFGGLNTDNPPVIIQPNEAAQCNNFMLRNNYISTRMDIQDILAALPDGNPCVGIVSCWNSATNVYFVYGISKANIYSLGIGNVWGSGSALAVNGTLNVSYVNVLGGTCFVNGSNYVYQMVGTGLNQLTNLYGAAYIMELAQTLLICNTFEGGTNYPQRIRWCNAGNITQWDPSTYVGAGFTDLLDVSDAITGVMAIGSVGYVLRRNGITQVTPTGNGVQPWYFNHLWASEHGIGVYYPGTVAQYGALCFLLAEDNVYTFTASSLNTIADNVMDTLAQDLGGAVNVYASVYPKRSGTYQYFCYEIYINISGPPASIIIWSYDIKNKNWTRHIVTGNSGIQLTAKPTSIFGGPGVV